MNQRLPWVLLLAALVAGCGNHRDKQATGPQVAPSFELVDLKGKAVRLEEFAGRPVLLDFWATWCGPCRVSMPTVQEFYSRHKDEGLIVLGLNMDEDPLSVPAFIQRMKITYPVLLAGHTAVAQQYGMEGLPLFVFINKKGQIVERFNGFHPDMVYAWEQLFEQLMAEPS